MDFPRHIFHFRDWLRDALQPMYTKQEAQALTQLLLEEILGVPAFVLSMYRERIFNEKEWGKVNESIARLLAGEPIQYILGKANFYGRDFRVDPSVLIPRGETEEICVWILETYKNQTKLLKGLDIGTGSGCIPITLKLEGEENGLTLEMNGLDVSEKALKLAQENSLELGADIHFHQQDILHASHEMFSTLDFIVSNPPYIPQGEMADLHTNVKDHEPHLALAVPNDSPIIFYDRIARLGKAWLKQGGNLFFETHEDFHGEVVAMLEKQGFREIRSKKDLNGKLRMVRTIN